MSTSGAAELLTDELPPRAEPGTLASATHAPAPAARRTLWHKVLLSSSSLALVDQTLVSGTNFAVGVLVTRYAGIYEMGVFTLAFTLLVLATNAHYSLIGAPFTFIANQLTPSQRHAMAGSTLVQHAIISLALALGFLAAAALAGWLGAPAWITTATVAVGLACPFVLLREFGRRCAFAELNVLTVVIIDGVAAAITLGGLLLLGQAGMLTGARAVLVIGAAGALVGLVWLVLERRKFQFVKAQFRGDVERGWAFGKWVLASQMASVTSAYITHWTLAALLNAAATGAFAACQNVAQLANPLLFGIANVIEPKASAAIARGGFAELLKVVNGFSRWLVGAVALLALAFAFGGDWLVHFLYGDAEPVLPVLVMPTLGLTMVISAVNVGLIHSLRAAQRSDVNIKADMLCFVVTLLVLLAAANHAGVLVGTLAMFAGNLCGLAVRYWGYRLVVYSPEVQS